MKQIKNIVLILGFILNSFPLDAQEKIPQKVLFVGNSYTYFWNLPQQVASMAQSQAIALTTRQSTSGGTNLGQHWRGERKLLSLDKIQQGDYDAVVLQDHSKRAIDYPDSLLHYGQLLGKEIQAKGARIFLYMTWAREFDPYMQTEITNKYTELARKINATLVPVGPAWARARELRPGFPLYDPDRSHPSALGTYLTACVFYGIITLRSPVGLPHRLMTKDADGEKLYLNIQSPEDALFCQKVAREILEQQSGLSLKDE
ncbi:MAG: hypothetical protein AAFU64_00230 [Bacteroidota bacterium]